MLYRKPGARREFLIVDGGMHHHYLLAGGMGQVIRRNFEMDAVPVVTSPCIEERAFDVAGCLCTPQDILANGYECRWDIRAGDRIVFFNSGAYGPSASPVGFLSHVPASEYVV